MEKHILTVDVEDNFTYEELANKNDWDKYENQVVENTLKILYLLKKYNARATFFVVGHVAERHPEIVEYICKENYEIASHSYWHKPLFTLSWEKIKEDIKKSKEILTSISCSKLYGYRAMGFSIPVDSDRFYCLLKDYGFIYHSSRRFPTDKRTTFTKNNSLYFMFPSYIELFQTKLIFSGGSYFRLLPLKVIEKGFSIYEKINEPVVLYIHSWEFNKDQPKRIVSYRQKILQSTITFTTEKKLVYLLERYNFVSVKEYLGL